ncbi:DEAD/DEAH box helicase [Propionibacteriaceae bacterium G1746]|uniref:DEAD/DEAH box helicase n=1 Tax=Aestuariimicrobium sp. G57 TaxID=3418485 RepID=UPI003D4A5FBB
MRQRIPPGWTRSGRASDEPKAGQLNTKIDEAEYGRTPTFADLGVLPEITQALAEAGITHPFPIQQMAIPLAIDGVDMIGQARTGTGKTLAFGVAVLQRVTPPQEQGHDFVKPGKPQALILCPTRELAVQVAHDLTVAGAIRKVRVLTVYGGVSYDPQLEALEAGVDVVVGTPGRVLDLVQRKALDLSAVRIAVLDEADEMLDLGFLPDVERLLGATPKDRQTLLFSATMRAQIVSLARAHLTRPVNIRAEGHDAQATVPDTTQFVYQAHDLDKPEIVGKVLQADDVEKVMVFTRTKRAAQRLADELEDRGFKAASIHGDLNQAAREKALKKFREGRIMVLVATDVAARGIDITGVSHVINYECPEDDKTYVHRIGRTGRAGAKGVAITLVDWADVTRWKVINKSLDLDFDTPVETYSSSPHLFTDLGIPEGTKARLQPSKPRDDSDDSDRHHGGRKGKHHRHDDGAESERPRRSRRRLRNGEVVNGEVVNGEVVADAPAPVGLDATTAARTDTDDRPRRRRRRRRPAGATPGDGESGSEQ